MHETEYLRLLNVLTDQPEQFPWQPDELRAVWLHLVNSSILIAIASSDPISALRAAQLCKDSSPPIQSLADLMQQAAPNPELFEIVAAGAQLHLDDPESVVPKLFAQTTLDLMLLHQRRAANAPLGQISDADLAERAGRLSSLEWLDPQTQQVIKEKRAALFP